MNSVLRSHDRLARLQWARERLCWGKTEWGNVFFSGEMKFNLSLEGELQLIKRRGERNRRNRNRQLNNGTDLLGRRNVLVWAGVSKGGKSDLVFINGELTPEKYIDEVIRQNVMLFAGAIGLDDFYFQDDERWPHQTSIVTELLESESIDRLEWPPKSDDLSPMENLWDVLARRAATRLHASSSLNDLKEVLQEEWRAIPQKSIDEDIDKMRSRLVECLDANGGRVFF